MTENQQNLRDFMLTESGKWMLDNFQKIRVSQYEKGEKDTDKASHYLSKSAGIAECISWINANVVTPKGK